MDVDSESYGLITSNTDSISLQGTNLLSIVSVYLVYGKGHKWGMIDDIEPVSANLNLVQMFWYNILMISCKAGSNTIARRSTNGSTLTLNCTCW